MQSLSAQALALQAQLRVSRHTQRGCCIALWVQEIAAARDAADEDADLQRMAAIVDNYPPVTMPANATTATAAPKL